MAQRQLTIIRSAMREGESLVLPLHADELRAIAANAGVPLRVTIEPVGDHYEVTRAAAKRMRGRFARTLAMLVR